MNSKISLLCLTLSICLAALFSGTDPSYSCGPGIDYEKYRISYVDPDLLSDSLYQSFYRTLLKEHQAGDNYGDMPHEEFRGEGWTAIREAETIRDWKSYLGESISDRSIHDLIYSMNPGMIEDVLSALDDGQKPVVRDVITPAGSEWDEPDTLYIAEALQVVVNREDVPFLRYLLYANRCSPYAWADDPWTDENEQNDTAAMLALIEEGVALHDACRSDYLKLRYAFQVVRMARYAGEYERAMEFYDRLVAPNPSRSPIRYRALGHKAGAARHSGNRPLSNYYFSHVFDSSAGDREIALRDFRVGSDEEWSELYELARNDHERATLWMMRGLKRDGLNFDYLREMYRLEPGSPRLAMGLMRELHRIESYLYDDMETRDYKVRQEGSIEEYDYEKDTTARTNVYDGYWYGSEDYRRHIAPGRSWDTLYYYRFDEEAGEEQLVGTLSGRDYVLEFRRFAMEIAKKGNVEEPALWYMVAGYIDMMDGDYGLADQCLDEARESVRGNYDLEHQIKLLDYLRQAKSKGKVGSDIEEHVVETLGWFREKQNLNRHTRYDKVMAEIGRQYLLQNDVPKAILAFNAAHDDVTADVLLDMYATNDELEELQELVEDGGENDYERGLIDSFPMKRADLLDLRGTRLMRQGKFEDALELFEKIPSSYWDVSPVEDEYGWTPPNFRTFYTSADTSRFTGMSLVSYDLWGETDPDSVARTIPGIRRYTKLSLARDAVDLAELADRKGKPGADSAAYRLGNLLFNTPYWGYAEGVWQGGLLISIRYYYYRATAYPFNLKGVAERMGTAEEKFMQEYGSRTLARGYFTRAMNGTSNAELAAHCAYMIDLCDKQPLTTLHPVPSIEEQSRAGYDLLITRYRDTRYAQLALSQCSIYKLFEKKRLGEG